MEADQRLIEEAWYEEASRARLGLRPGGDRILAVTLTPLGGEWTCTAVPGAVTRSIEWNGQEVALVNPRGRLDDVTEGQIAMGLCATPLLDKAMRSIYVLSEKLENLDLIRRIALTAISYIERPAPEIHEPHDDESGED